MTSRIRNPLRQPLKRMGRRIHRWFPNVDPHHQKVFGIGLSRTGTKSLHQALETLGFFSDHFSTHLLVMKDGNLCLNWREVTYYDALTDVTAAHFFRELDHRYPGSKFILTVRDSHKWLSSCERHFPPLAPGHWPYGVQKILELRREVYGTLSFNRERFLSAYQTHVSTVKDYFKDRPEDLLVLDITKGEGWDPVCQFLACPRPTQDFPWANAAGRNSKLISKSNRA